MLNYDIGNDELVHEKPKFQPGLPVAKRDPLDPAPLLEGFSHYEPMITDMEAEVNALQVTDHESAARCAAMAGQARSLVNEIEKTRKDKGAPFKSVLDALMSTCKPFTARLDKMRSVLESKNRSFLMEEDRKRREAEAKARAEAERQRKEAEEKARAEAEAKAKAMNVPVEEVPVAPAVVAPVYIPPDETKITTEAGSQKIEYEMVPTIADFRALPDECLQARQKEITAAVMPWIRARGKAGIYNDPGVVWTKTPKVSTRVSR